MTVFPDYDSPRAIKALLESRGMSAQKRFGQNFLVNRGARERIASFLALSPGARIWEIGPGIGAMTAAIAATGASLTLFEIDKGFIGLLGELFGEKASIVEGDVLKTWRGAYAAQGMPDIVFGNLPYNAAGAIIADFAESGFVPPRMVFCVQKEGAERMAAKPGGKNYSSFSVLCQSRFQVESLMRLKPTSFYPEPQVESAVVRLTPREGFPMTKDEALFFSLVRAAFSSRRKTLRNNLQAYLGGTPGLAEVLLEAVGMDPASRAEEHAPERFAALADEALKRGIAGSSRKA
jgi:16S rRNA (adenine1518-N6/adenine1519-N6)-dimethyltransferase